MIVYMRMMKLKQSRVSLKDDPRSKLSKTATAIGIVNDMVKQSLY